MVTVIVLPVRVAASGRPTSEVTPSEVTPSEVTPSEVTASGREAFGGPPLGAAPMTRQPVTRVACSDASTASRRICSTRGWGACWPGSATTSVWARPSPNASWKRVISRPVSVVQKTTSEDQSTLRGASFLSCWARPQRRKYSIVRAETVLARGRSQFTSGRGSITAQATPCRFSSMAAASPTGPPPEIRTGTRVGRSVGTERVRAAGTAGSEGTGTERAVGTVIRA